MESGEDSGGDEPEAKNRLQQRMRRLEAITQYRALDLRQAHAKSDAAILDLADAVADKGDSAAFQTHRGHSQHRCSRGNAECAMRGIVLELIIEAWTRNSSLYPMRGRLRRNIGRRFIL